VSDVSFITPAIDLAARPCSGVTVHQRIRTVVLPAGVLVIWAFSLSRSLFDPIGYDQALYQYMAERVIAGDRLYVDVWDQNGPGIVAIHWLSTRLVGSSPVALRLFDAGWQALTLLALIGLAGRDGRCRTVGWIAAGLYALSYYSMGYVHTAQREGFAVLPLLLMLHLVIRGNSARWCKTRFFAAGALGLFVFSIKPPLGLAFGAVWLYTIAAAWRHRRGGLRALHPVALLTLGFLAAAAAGVALIAHAGSWDACWGVLSRRDMPGYVQGPKLIRTILPGIVVGAAALAVCLVVASKTRARGVLSQPVRTWAIGCMLFTLLLSCRQWLGWQHVLVCFSGLWIPAFASLIRTEWRERSETWQLTTAMLLAVTAAVILQGQFFLYHLPPMLALAAYLAATEIVDAFSTMSASGASRPVWPVLCLGSIAYLIAGQWWPTMSFVTAHPHVLAGTNLADHYTSITKHKLSCPTYATTIKATDRIRELTREDEPIATLFHEARIYYFARRPAVYKLLCMQSIYAHMFADYMQAIHDRRPKVIVARIPERLRESGDLHAIEAAVFNEAESFFGPPARTIRELYHVTERIDDLCLLAPKREQ